MISLNLPVFSISSGQAGAGTMCLTTVRRFKLQISRKQSDRTLQKFNDGWYQKKLSHRKGSVSRAPHFFGNRIYENNFKTFYIHHKGVTVILPLQPLNLKTQWTAFTSLRPPSFHHNPEMQLAEKARLLIEV